jgi:propanol-preferring alcohol dehydrogenase
MRVGLRATVSEEEIIVQHRLTVAVTPYPMERADVALADLAADRVNGAAVLMP